MTKDVPDALIEPVINQDCIERALSLIADIVDNPESLNLQWLKSHRWAVVRLDGDLYESTTDSLENLYDGLTPGGWLIVDDFEITACRQAVTDFVRDRGLNPDIKNIDDNGAYWQV